jgi:hypothetical protein
MNTPHHMRSDAARRLDEGIGCDRDISWLDTNTKV